MGPPEAHWSYDPGYPPQGSGDEANPVTEEEVKSFLFQSFTQQEAKVVSYLGQQLCRMWIDSALWEAVWKTFKKGIEEAIQKHV